MQANADDGDINSILAKFGTLKVPYVAVLRKGQVFGSCICTDFRHLKRFLRKARELNAAEAEISSSSEGSATESSGGET